MIELFISQFYTFYKKVISHLFLSWMISLLSNQVVALTSLFVSDQPLPSGRKIYCKLHEASKFWLFSQFSVTDCKMLPAPDRCLLLVTQWTVKKILSYSWSLRLCILAFSSPQGAETAVSTKVEKIVKDHPVSYRLDCQFWTRGTVVSLDNTYLFLKLLNKKS